MLLKNGRREVTVSFPSVDVVYTCGQVKATAYLLAGAASFLYRWAACSSHLFNGVQADMTLHGPSASTTSSAAAITSPAYDSVCRVVLGLPLTCVIGTAHLPPWCLSGRSREHVKSAERAVYSGQWQFADTK